MSRLELCQRLIEEAMKCLGNGDKERVLEKIEELIKNQCHDGRMFGREVADKVKDVVHELWLVSDNEHRCGLLKMLKDLGVSKGWVKMAAHTTRQYLDKCLAKCNIDWKSKATRSSIVKAIEDLLRERFGWSEVRMCEEMWRFVGIDVDEFRKYGIEPCSWLNGLEALGDLRRPYWFGMARSDMTVKTIGMSRLELSTTNSISAVFFPVLLDAVETPGLFIKWKKILPGVKYVSKAIELIYYIDLSLNAWSWPTKSSANELKRILDGFSDEELAEFVAGIIDGDGTVRYEGSVYVMISACKNCPKRMVLDVLKDIIAKRFGIIGNIYHETESNDSVLMFGGGNAVRLLRLIRPFVHHPLRRLRAELILALYDGRISLEEFERLYEQTEYEQGRDDIKRNRGLETLARAAPQTHTHGVLALNHPQASAPAKPRCFAQGLLGLIGTTITKDKDTTKEIKQSHYITSYLGIKNTITWFI
jgi:hypothetical protein